MLDAAKSCIPSQWASVVLSWQDCCEAKLGLDIYTVC